MRGEVLFKLAVGLLTVVAIGSFSIALNVGDEKQKNTPVKTPAPSTPERGSSPGTVVDALRVGNAVIRVGDLTDDVFPILLPYKTGTPETRNDPDNPTSLAVRHRYRIDRKAYIVEARRREDPGPYRVFAIYTEVPDSNSPTVQSTPDPPPSSSTVKGFSANWLLAVQLEKHQKTIRALTDAKNSWDMDAFKRILRLRSRELAAVIDEVSTGAYSISDKQKMLEPLEKEKDWADSSLAAFAQLAR
jgi:hypothetical protein